MSALSEQEFLPKERVKALIGWFLMLTFAFTAPLYAMIIQFTPTIWVAAFMWAPGLAALAACKAMDVNNQILGWKWGLTRWQVASYFIPLFYVLTIYLLATSLGLIDTFNAAAIDKWADSMGLVGWTTDEAVWVVIPLIAFVVFMRQAAYSMGEEIGWRGLLAPQLMRLYNFPVAALLSGIIWFVWHLPIIIWGGYNTGYAELETQIFNFGVMIIAISFPMLYLRLRSGSVWTAGIFHAAHNMAFLAFAETLFLNKEDSELFVGEWGYITAGITTLIAIVTIYFAKRDGVYDRIKR